MSTAGEAPAEPLIVVDRVTKVYGRRGPREVRALDEVSLEVRRGERFGIVGESGSGKSTLIRLLAGLDQPTSGAVTVDGKRVSGRSERQLRFLRSQLQFVFQDPMASLDPRMRIRDIIAEPLAGQARAAVDARVAELLVAVGLPADAAQRYPHQFSGGQRQRISIARALAPRPSVLIADEPVSALDVSVRAQILNLLMDLTETLDFTLVFVSHDLSVVKHLCDRVAVLYHGQLVEVGDTAHIYSGAAEPYTKSLIEAVPTIRAALDGVTGHALARRSAAAAGPDAVEDAE
jgi:ABC-type glutathione transport system ATPase component